MITNIIKVLLHAENKKKAKNYQPFSNVTTRCTIVSSTMPGACATLSN